MTEVNEQTQQLAEELAAPIIKEHQALNKQKKRFNHRNRAAWKRMNRPSQLAKAEKGHEFIMSVLARAGF